MGSNGFQCLLAVVIALNPQVKWIKGINCNGNLKNIVNAHKIATLWQTQNHDDIRDGLLLALSDDWRFLHHPQPPIRPALISY